MIAGTVVFEDLTMNFSLRHDGSVQYTVCDAVRGHAATLEIPAEVFFNAMATAMAPDAISPEVSYSDMEQIMPQEKHLISPVRPDQVDEVLHALRWIP